MTGNAGPVEARARRLDHSQRTTGRRAKAKNATAGAFADVWFETSGLGRLGPDKGEGGKYLLVPPGYKGELDRKSVV